MRIEKKSNSENQNTGSKRNSKNSIPLNQETSHENNK